MVKYQQQEKEFPILQWFDLIDYIFSNLIVFLFFQNSSNAAPSTPTNSTWNTAANSNIAEKKQEPHTPPVTPQQPIVTAS